ncbi:hypothetical protein EMN47_17685 [Prolixibacteraceae bacterium JC049]|nr:hypothetical protein [Prolixibacteraceae bacterium JC049]
MRCIVLITLLVSIAFSAQSQKLIDIYKKGTIKLVADTEYGKNNNWNKVLSTYNDTLYGKHMGNRKNIQVLPDGSVVVSHAYRNFYSLFDAKGNFVKEFKVTNNSGKELKVKQLAGVLDNSILFTGLDNMGYMKCFDFDGHLLKTLRLNYITKQMLPLPGKKIAVVGWAIWADRFRDFVAIVDYETNEEQYIWNHYTPRNNDKKVPFAYSHRFKKGGAVSMRTMPFMNNLGLRPAPQLTFANNRLIVAIPPTGEIIEFSLDGKKLSSKKVNWNANQISINEQNKIQKKAIAGIKANLKRMSSPDYLKKLEAATRKTAKLQNSSAKELEEMLNKVRTQHKEQKEKMMEAYSAMLKDMEKDLPKINKAIPKPFFSSCITDSDGNILFFEYPEKGKSNKLNVYSLDNGGKFICTSTFECNDFDLIINSGKLKFHKGYLYGIQKLKKADGIPLRVVRFKLQ